MSRMAFGVKIDEDIIFKCSVVLLCSLSALWLFILVVILRLRNVQHQVNKAIEVTTNRNVLRMPQISPCSYMDLTVEENKLDNASVDGGTTQREQSMAKESNTLALLSDSEPSEDLKSFLEEPKQGPDYVKIKNYKSLKCRTDVSYAKLYEATLEINGSSADDQNNIHRDNKKDPENDDAQKDTAPDYENEYLAVIASNMSADSPQGAEMSMSRQEDDSGYLVPIDSLPNENQEGIGNSGCKPKAAIASERQGNVQAAGCENLEYDYANPREIKELKAPPGSASSSQEAQRVKKDTEDEKAMSCFEHYENSYCIIKNRNELKAQDDANCGSKEHAQNHQSVIDGVYDSIHEADNRGCMEMTDRVPREMEVTPNVQTGSDGPACPSKVVQRKATECKAKSAFDNSDERPVYANEQILRNKNAQK